MPRNGAGSCRVDRFRRRLFGGFSRMGVIGWPRACADAARLTREETQLLCRRAQGASPRALLRCFSGKRYRCMFVGLLSRSIFNPALTLLVRLHIKRDEPLVKRHAPLVKRHTPLVKRRASFVKRRASLVKRCASPVAQATVKRHAASYEAARATCEAGVRVATALGFVLSVLFFCRRRRRPLPFSVFFFCYFFVYEMRFVVPTALSAGRALSEELENASFFLCVSCLFFGLLEVIMDSS